MVRLKHRYLLVNILYPHSKEPTTTTRPRPGDDIPLTIAFRQPTSDRVDAKFLLKVIRDGVSELFGDYGSGMIAGSLQVKYFSPATSTAIIRVSRDHYRLVWAALTFTTHLPKPVDESCVMQVVRVSGTIKKAEEEAIRRARLSIKRARRASVRTTSIGSVTTRNGEADAHKPDDEQDSPDFADGIEDVAEHDDEDDESE